MPGVFILIEIIFYIKTIQSSEKRKKGLEERKK